MRVEKVQQETVQNQQNQATVSEKYLNCIFGQTNPIKNNKDATTKKEELYMVASQLDDGVREKFLEYLEKGETPKDFIDYLNERYEKKQEQFEIAWAEYQEAKNNLKLLEKVYNILMNKYNDSDSAYEQGQLEKAYKNKLNSSWLVDALLAKASDIAHKVI